VRRYFRRWNEQSVFPQVERTIVRRGLLLKDREIRMSKPSDNPSGQPIGGQWAQQQKRGLAKQEATAPGSHRQLSDTEQKELEEQLARDAENTSETPGGAGDPQASRLEPEKQGGIGGP
jgi:hypothetical protein